MTASKKLKLEISSPGVLPEIVNIIEEMVRLYNDYESPTYLKLSCSILSNPDNLSPTTSRYELYNSKIILLEAIENNCPAGCSLVYE